MVLAALLAKVRCGRHGIELAETVSPVRRVVEITALWSLEYGRPIVGRIGLLHADRSFLFAAVTTWVITPTRRHVRILRPLKHRFAWRIAEFGLNRRRNGASRPQNAGLAIKYGPPVRPLSEASTRIGRCGLPS